jgi:hypothetical protein
MLATAVLVTSVCIFIIAVLSDWLPGASALVATALLLGLVTIALLRWLGPRPERAGTDAVRSARSELAVVAAFARVALGGSGVVLIVGMAEFLRGDMTFALEAVVAGALGCLASLAAWRFARRVAASFRT